MMANFRPTDDPPKPGSGQGRRLFAGKNMALLGGFGVLILFPDVVFHLVFQVLHFGIGWLELAVEHALQSALSVSRHTAQMITAWLGLGVFVVLLIWLYRKFSPRVRNFWLQCRQLAKGR